MFLKTDGAGNLSFDSLSFSTPLAVIGNATSGSEIRLPEDTDNGSNYVALKAPDTIASNLTLTLPSADGSSGQVLQTNGSGVLSFSSVSDNFSTKLLYVRDEKSAGVDGGTATSGSFATRDLNTVVTNEISGASLSSNQITLPSGTYFIIATIPSYSVQYDKVKLRNITDSTDTLIGTSSYSGVSASQINFIFGRFTIGSTKTFAIQHRVGLTVTTYGFGLAEDYGVTEVYTNSMIWKVA